MIILYFLFTSMLYPLGLEKDLSSKSYTTRVNATQRLAELNDFSYVGIIFVLKHSKDEQVKETLEKEIELRLELNNRKKFKKLIDSFSNGEVVLEPEGSDMEDYIEVFKLCKTTYDKSLFRQNIYNILDFNIYSSKFYLSKYMYENHSLDIYEYISLYLMMINNVGEYYSCITTKTRWLNSYKDLNSTVLTNIFESNKDIKFWKQLRYIIKNDLFFNKEMK